ncbi:hypothetical protein M9458_051653 [Cirrhinus mrigala]|uniref:Uncharacterized protein n=1 Tax=Cirrhinus mrigala TaxID=683832 RepID=A0ABD0MVF3_CIRMR
MDGLTGNDLGLVGERRMAKNTGLEQERNEANNDGLERETCIVNNAGMERERSGINEAGPKNGQQERNNQFTSKRKYLKEATVIVNVEEINEVRAMDIIKAVTEKYGNGKILALRPRQGKEYELTMENEEVCDDLADGLLVKGVNCEVKKLQNRDYVVSFIHLPAYLDDEMILNKLEGWGACFPPIKNKKVALSGHEHRGWYALCESAHKAGDGRRASVFPGNAQQPGKGSNEEEQSATPAQAQQIPAEEDENGAEARNGVAENERDNQTEQTVDLTWTPMEIMPSFKDLLEAAEKDEQKEQIDRREETEEQTEKDKIVRRQTRRSSKVTPKLDIPKKVIKKDK